MHATFSSTTRTSRSTPVVAFDRRGRRRPQVLAIKQTLYRTGRDSPIVQALARAAENGKQVAALVELKARFDEERNIDWARALEEAGVHVVYGFVGFKTHCKAAWSSAARRTASAATSTSPPATTTRTPRGSTRDLGYFTAPGRSARTLTALFNLLTGYSQPARLTPAARRASRAARARDRADRPRGRTRPGGRPARIIAKMNALVDRAVIEALYERHRRPACRSTSSCAASAACARACRGSPKHPRHRASSTAILEHARIFFFENAGEVDYLSSADWMPRNFHRRVEIVFPVLDPKLQAQVREILDVQLAETVKARRILPDGSSVRVQADGGPLSALRRRLYDLTGAVGVIIS